MAQGISGFACAVGPCTLMMYLGGRVKSTHPDSAMRELQLLLHCVPLPRQDFQAIEQDTGIIIVAAYYPSLQLLNKCSEITSSYCTWEIAVRVHKQLKGELEEFCI